MVAIRAESPRDLAQVYAVLARAFPSDAEARLVDSLRGETDPQISLVAEDERGVVTGHILFTPVEIHSPAGPSTALGLGPMAVSPPLQREGIGSRLVEAGLAECRRLGELVVVVLGHPLYYPRFGFQPAWDFELYYQTRGPNPGFMVREIEPGAIAGRRGEVTYHALFSEV